MDFSGLIAHNIRVSKSRLGTTMLEKKTIYRIPCHTDHTGEKTRFSQITCLHVVGMTDNQQLSSLRDYVTEQGTNIFINCTSLAKYRNNWAMESVWGSKKGVGWCSAGRIKNAQRLCCSVSNPRLIHCTLSFPLFEHKVLFLLLPLSLLLIVCIVVVVAGDMCCCFRLYFSFYLNWTGALGHSSPF